MSMDANQLMFWLKGHFDLSNEPPSRDAWGFIKAHIMEAYPVVERQVAVNPTRMPPNFELADCGCKGKH